MQDSLETKLERNFFYFWATLVIHRSYPNRRRACFLRNVFFLPDPESLGNTNDNLNICPLVSMKVMKVFSCDSFIIFSLCFLVLFRGKSPNFLLPLLMHVLFCMNFRQVDIFANFSSYAPGVWLPGQDVLISTLF